MENILDIILLDVGGFVIYRNGDIAYMSRAEIAKIFQGSKND